MENKCVLKLERLFFQNIEFKRIGFRNDNAPEFELATMISQNDEKLYKVAVKIQGQKKDEYEISVEINGIFGFSGTDGVSDELKKKMISTNAVAILMPYLRSEISLLTAQPETESIVLPPFNIASLMNQEK